MGTTPSGARDLRGWTAATVIAPPVGTEALYRAASALVGVLMLLAASIWLLRRHGGSSAFRGSRPSSRLAITSRLTLDTRTRLVLVRRDAVEHLLAIGPSGVQLLETLPTPREPSVVVAVT